MRQIISAKALAVLLIVTAASVHIFCLNGSSADFSDTEAYLIVTDSMDGDGQSYRISSIPKDSLIFAKRVDPSAYDFAIGDVVGYRTGLSSHLTFHRIVSLDDAIVTKGDAYDLTDIIDRDSIECIVVGVDPYIGKMISFVRSDVLFSVLVLLNILALNEVVRSLKEDFRNDRRRK